MILHDFILRDTSNFDEGMDKTEGQAYFWLISKEDNYFVRNI
jgi:hypothetical protein